MDNTFNPSKILIINIFGIGDVLFTTPIISHLKKHNPNIQIGYLCNRRTAPTLEANPKVDQVFIYERDEFNAVYKKSKISFWKKINKFIDEIKEQQYDVVLDLSMNTFTGLFSWRAGIKNRIGFDYKKRGLFLNKKIPLEGYERKHVVEYYLDLLKEIGIPVVDSKLELFISDEDQRWAEQFIEDLDIGNKNIIGIIPGGGASWGKDAEYKRWPVENYAKLVDKLIEKFSATIILMGSSQEEDLCQKVMALTQKRIYSSCGQTNIGQLAALMQKCSLNIVNDGGPLHIAVAAGAKTVSIFGPVDENVYGPYPLEGHGVVSANISCRPCYHRFRRANCEHISCLRNIKSEDVLIEVEKLL